MDSGNTSERLNRLQSECDKELARKLKLLSKLHDAKVKLDTLQENLTMPENQETSASNNDKDIMDFSMKLFHQNKLHRHIVEESLKSTAPASIDIETFVETEQEHHASRGIFDCTRVNPLLNHGFDPTFTHEFQYQFDEISNQPQENASSSSSNKTDKSGVNDQKPDKSEKPEPEKADQSCVEKEPVTDDGAKAEYKGLEGLENVISSGSDSQLLTRSRIASVINDTVQFNNDDETTWRDIHWFDLPKLIELMTSDAQDVAAMRRIVILTHTIFCDSRDLLKALSNRYFQPYPSNLTPSELFMYAQKTLHPMRLRVIGVIKYWMKEHWMDDFHGNKHLQEHVLKFISDVKDDKTAIDISKTYEYNTYVANVMSMSSATRCKKLAQQLTNVVTQQQLMAQNMENRLSVRRSTGYRCLTPHSPQSTSTEKTRSASNSIDRSRLKHYILSFKISDLANALMEMSNMIFVNLKSRECVNKAWSDSRSHMNTIAQITSQHEAIAAMFQSEVLSCGDIDTRSKVLETVINLASQSVELGNFHAAHGLYSSISSNILRLRKTLAQVDPKCMKKYDQLKRLFSQSANRVNLRNKIQEYLGRPCIPEFSIIVKDLTFVEDGNKSTSENLINWFKCRKLATIIEQIKMHQNQNTMLLSSNNVVDGAAMEYLEANISNWQRMLAIKGDKIIWTEFRNLSKSLE